MLRTIAFLVLCTSCSLRAQFPPTLALETFSNTLGHLISHENLPNPPSSMAMADVNGDGLADMLLGIPSWGLPNLEEAGKVYVIYGDTALADTIDPSTLDGLNGFFIEGTEAGGLLGKEVSAAGDLNGDGLEDFLVGAPGIGAQSGACYAIFGEKNRDPETKVDLEALDGSNGFVIEGVLSGEELGANLSSAGDINGDGLDDLLVGVPKASGGGQVWAGKAFAVLGNRFGHEGKLELASLDGSQGFTMTGASFQGVLGDAVGNLGDFNGDGIDDFALGAWGEDPGGVINAGATYVVFGSASGFERSLDLSTLDGKDGFAIQGINQQDGSGWALSRAGDLNGDGLTDLAITSLGHDGTNGNEVGKVHVVFGKRGAWPSRLLLEELNGINGFALSGAEAGDRAGMTLAALGDLNGDCLDDMLIGAPSADRQGLVSSGELYVLFGNRNRNDSILQLRNINTVPNGFIIQENQDRSFAGSAVCGGRDVNGDGRPDLAFSCVRGTFLLCGQQNVLFSNEATFSLGPNPNRGLFSFFLRENTQAESYSFQLFNLGGQEIPLPPPQPGAGCLLFDIQPLSPGVYLLAVNQGGQTSAVRLVKW